MTSRLSLRYVVALLAIGCAFTPMLGCGGSGGGGGVTLPPAVVSVQAAIAAHHSGAVDAVAVANTIDSVIVTTTSAGDTFDIAGASARIERADGTQAAVTLAINAGKTQITLGQALCTPSATTANKLIIAGPVSVRDSATGETTVIGRLEFWLECLADGTVVSPDTLTVDIPVRGAAPNKKIVMTGLDAGDMAKVIIVDNIGGRNESAVATASAAGTATITDGQGAVTAGTLSGNNSRVQLMFGQTDTTPANGVPDIF